jgi:hypothetical protein
MSVCRAVVCESVHGASGERGVGCLRYLAMSWRLVRIRSVEELCGMVTLVGKQESVLHVHFARVSHIHTA